MFAYALLCLLARTQNGRFQTSKTYIPVNILALKFAHRIRYPPHFLSKVLFGYSINLSLAYIISRLGVLLHCFCAIMYSLRRRLLVILQF